MNLIEKLTREVRRVAVIREHYHETERLVPRSVAGVAFIGDMIDKQLEDACLAAGSNDIVRIARAINDLEAVNE